MLSTVSLIVALGAAVSATEYGRISASPVKGTVFWMDVALDRETMVTSPGGPHPKPDCFLHTINFHDFQKKLVAIKSVDRGACYIKVSKETYKEMEKILEDFRAGNTKPITQATEEWTVPEKAVDAEDVAQAVGDKIANFCTGYNVILLADAPLNTSREGRASKCEVACVSCSGSVFEATQYSQ
ncbi:uncharacterized protein [Haliotis cracherodii]|uniref:uncharacterized protein n=1 Tax=Haliotis cracherodii TaxID=6455 RepID=UPI0039E7595E